MAPRIEIKTRKEYVSKQLIETIKNISTNIYNRESDLIIHERTIFEYCSCYGDVSYNFLDNLRNMNLCNEQEIICHWFVVQKSSTNEDYVSKADFISQLLFTKAYYTIWRNIHSY